MAATMGGHCKQYHMPFADVRQTIVRRSTNDRATFDKQSCDVRQTIVRRSTKNVRLVSADGLNDPIDVFLHCFLSIIRQHTRPRI